MNLIKHQADDFYRVHDREQYKEFTQSLRYQLLEYRKDSHKLEFIEQIRDIVKQDYEAHLNANTKMIQKNVMKIEIMKTHYSLFRMKEKILSTIFQQQTSANKRNKVLMKV